MDKFQIEDILKYVNIYNYKTISSISKRMRKYCQEYLVKYKKNNSKYEEYTIIFDNWKIFKYHILVKKLQLKILEQYQPYHIRLTFKGWSFEEINHNEGLFYCEIYFKSSFLQDTEKNYKMEINGNFENNKLTNLYRRSIIDINQNIEKYYTFYKNGKMENIDINIINDDIIISYYDSNDEIYDTKYLFNHFLIKNFKNWDEEQKYILNYFFIIK